MPVPRRPRKRLAALAAPALWLALGTPPLSAQPRTGGGATDAAAVARRDAAPVTLNFVNADIEAVTRAMAAMIDRQMLVDPRVKGVITVYSEQPVPVREAYLNYLAALRGLGFAVVDAAGLLKVVPEADAKLQTGTVSVDNVEQRGDQIITQIFRLNFENPNNLVAVLRPLISPNNTINANPGTNSLVITDYAGNLARIAKMIAALDQPANSDIEVVALKHAIAADLAPLVQRLGDGSSGGLAAPGTGGALTVMAEPRSNALIVRASNPARQASVRTLIQQLDVPMAGGPAGAIHVVYLKNADAIKLATVLRAAFGGGGGGGSSGSGGFTSSTTGARTTTGTGVTSASGVSGATGAGSAAATTPVAASAEPSTGGFIQADPSTNSLIISAAEPLYRQIRQVVDQLDGRRAQIYVETMIVEMEANKAAEFGIQWQSLMGKKGNQYIGGIGTSYGAGPTNLLNLSQNVKSDAPSVAGAAFQGLNLAIAKLINGEYTLSGLARFLESVQGTNILSTPNLVALDNEEAKIVVGANVPFVTGSFTNTGASGGTVNPFQTVERKDVGLTLRIKPQIGEGGTVRMTVFQENSSIVLATINSNLGPSTNKSSIETTVVVDDGAVMVLGGQLKDQYDGNEDKVPVIGDVPLVGPLFRSESRTRKKSNLLVFLRPVVIRDAQTAGTITLDRYEAIRAYQQAVQPRPSSVIQINDAPVLPPLAAPVSAATRGAAVPEAQLATPVTPAAPPAPPAPKSSASQPGN